MRPTKLKEIIGQDRAKQVCQTLIDSAIQRNDSVPHILFYGFSGVGKTTFSQAIANERGTQFHQINGAGIKSPTELERVISKLALFDLLFIDEIHRLSDKTCEWLYTVMEDFKFSTMCGTGLRYCAVPKFTLIGATTNLGSLIRPFRNRFKFTVEFTPYSLQELADISALTLKDYGFTIKGDIAEVIAKTCRGIPRLVVSRTEWVRDWMVANKQTNLNKDKVLEVIALQGVDENGFTEIDKKYLKALEYSYFLGLKQLSHMLNTDEETIKNEVEPFLIQSGLVGISKQGRFLVSQQTRLGELI